MFFALIGRNFLSPCPTKTRSHVDNDRDFVDAIVLVQKLKLILKNTIIDKTLTYALETSTLTKRDRKQLNIFERKVYRRILGPVHDNEKENWRILTNE